MIYDPKRRVYIENGRILTPQEVRDHLETFIDGEKKQVDHEAVKVLAGGLAVGAFFSWLRDKVRAWHSIAGVVAYGGQGQMNVDRWKRINEKIQSELLYLHKFQVEVEQGMRATRTLAGAASALVEDNAAVPAGLEAVVEREVQSALMTSAASRPAAIRQAVTSALADSIPTETAEAVASEVTASLLQSQRMEELIWGQLSSRGSMYADSSYATFANQEKARESDEGTVRGRRVCAEDDASCEECVALARDEYVPLDELADIGDAICLSNCRCVIEFELFNVEPLTIDREVYA